MADEPIVGTLKELSVAYATKQPKQVDNLLEDTPVLDSVRFENASHSMWNVYEEVTDIEGGGFVDMDAPLGEMEMASELKRVDLSILGGKVFVPEDKALALGGAPAYFAKKQPKFLRKLGVDAETTIIYDNLRLYALDNGKAISAGGSANLNFCILAVRWVPGETIGLYSKMGLEKAGALFNVMKLHDGALYEHPTTGVLGYGVRYKGYFGMQLANENTVAGIFNVDKDSATQKLPTAAQVDDMLDMVRAGEGTYVYCHRKMLSVLAQVGKDSAFQMGPGDKHVDRRIAEWNGVPIVTSYNFVDGAEANVTIA